MPPPPAYACADSHKSGGRGGGSRGSWEEHVEKKRGKKEREKNEKRANNNKVPWIWQSSLLVLVKLRTYWSDISSLQLLSRNPK
jgi:hypothetical protein